MSTENAIKELYLGSSFRDADNAKANKMPKRNVQWQLSAKAGGAENQYQLDAGQKRFGATQCPECNIVYQLGDAEDENAHLNYHNSMRVLKFQVNYNTFIKKM